MAVLEGALMGGNIMDAEGLMRQTLDGHLYSMVCGEFGHYRVVDLLSRDPADRRDPPMPWTDTDLRQLYDMKRAGKTFDEIELTMGRNRRSISEWWRRRREWKDRVFSPRRNIPSLEEIIRVVCAVYGIGQGDLVSSNRHANVTEARQVYYWIARNVARKSLPLIGLWAGDRDPSTVMHGIEKITRALDVYRDKIELCLFDLGLEWSAVENVPELASQQIRLP
jgi:hypothetical protein